MTKTEKKTLVFVAQTRWIGNDEWTNGIYVGRTVEAVEAAILDDENETIRDNNECPGVVEGDPDTGWIKPFESFADLAAESEFCVDVWDYSLL